MIKVMVVDDEALILGKIVYLLKSSSIEFESITEAGNGQEALQGMDGGNVPDLVLTDIRMPLVDGLELIERASAAYPGVRFVVISGYAEFEYAVKAMQYGVTRYVLKPVKASELIKAVEDIRDEIVAGRHNAEQARLATTADLSNRQVDFDNRLFNWLTSRDHDMEALQKLAQEIEVLNCRCYATAIFMLHSGVDDESFDRSGFFQSALESQPHKWRLLENPFIKGVFVVILGGTSEWELERAADATIGRLHRRLRDTFDATVTVGLGRTGELKSSYRSAVAASKRRFQSGAGKLYDDSSTPLQPRKEAASKSFVVAVKLAEQSLESKNIGKAIALLRAFAKETFVEHVADYCESSSIDYLFNEYINIVIRYCLKNNLELLERIEQEIYSGMALEALADKDAVYSLLSSMLDRIFAEADERDAKNGPFQSSVIDNIIRYIDRNIHEEVTLQTVSEKFSVNPSYLSRVFKAATGEGFVRYVTGRKIDKAKELLERGVMDLADIAHGLGFSDQQYFSRVYKKTTGFTPNEWRTQSKKSPKNT